jgi:hypothetical protein
VRRDLPWLIAAAVLAGGCFVGGCGDDEVVENCHTEPGVCGELTICEPTQVEAKHTDACEAIEWETNPPTSGEHYIIWAAFQVYDQPVPRGFWLHSAEHSAVVLLYNCDRFAGDCAELSGALADFAAARDVDPLCDAPVRNRILVTPDPKLDVAFAAVAWGHSLEGSCFDEAAVTAFTDAHYGKNYENFCSGGVDPTDPANDFPADCGE